jgi:hypothetical protein
LLGDAVTKRTKARTRNRKIFVQAEQGRSRKALSEAFGLAEQTVAEIVRAERHRLMHCPSSHYSLLRARFEAKLERQSSKAAQALPAEE